MNLPRIGILGGMGPRATAEFEQRLLGVLKGNDQDLPDILSVNCGAIPDRTNFLQNKGPDPLEALTRYARQLMFFQPDIVCMPCNTAHNPKILNRLLAVVPMPIIDMPAACILYAEKQKLQKLLILGTKGTRDGKIFDARTVSSICIYPDDTTQDIVIEVIQTIKNGHIPATTTLNMLIENCKKLHADATILACTELSLLPKGVFQDMIVIDSLDVLAQRCNEIVTKGS